MNSYFWAKNGHEIVAKVAFTKIDTKTKEKALYYLDGVSIEEASTWMDRIKKNPSYTYMKP